VAALAAGVMAAPLASVFLRGSLEARFGDMAPPVAVVGAWLFATAVAGAGRSVASRVLGGALAAALFALTALSIWSLQSVRPEMLRAGLLTSPLAVFRQGARVSQELAGLPDGLRGPDVPSPSGRAAYYLNACTNPDDRIMVVSYAPEVGGLSGRLFGGGRATFVPGFYIEDRYSQFLFARLASQSVPIVLAEEEPYYAGYSRLGEYLRDTYEERGRVEIDGGRFLRVLARRGRPSRPFGPEGLPCFTASAGGASGASQLR
jgi:hypothetical protein